MKYSLRPPQPPHPVSERSLNSFTQLPFVAVTARTGMSVTELTGNG